MMWMKTAGRRGSIVTPLTYTQMQYEFNKEGDLNMDLVNLSSVHRPVQGIEVMHSKSTYKFKDVETFAILRELRYFIFRCSTVVFWGNKEYDNFVDPSLVASATVIHHDIFTINRDELNVAARVVEEWCTHGVAEVLDNAEDGVSDCDDEYIED